MKMSYDFGTQKIDFTVLYTDRKTLSIEVEAPNVITVIAPVNTPPEKILETVKTKSKWIVGKLFEIREMEYRKSRKQYVNGESFIYLGRNYSLQIVVDPQYTVPETKQSRGKFFIYSNTKDEPVIRKALEKWYRAKAKEKIKERIEYYQPYFDAKPNTVRIKDQQKRWGSCTSKKELLFNWRCVMAPSPVLDYIVVHEMCHLIHQNHSNEFWALLKRVLPDYEARKDWLKNNGIKYDI